MQVIEQFLTEYEKVIDVIQLVFFFVISIMLYRKSGNIKYLLEAFDDMKFRKAGYNVTEKVDKKTGAVTTETLSVSQSFNKLVPIYRLNKATGELENTGEFVDIQAQIDSFKDTALKAMLERFMPEVVNETADLTQVNNDIDFLSETFDVAEEWRERFGLGETATMQDIFSYMKEYSQKLNDKLKVNGGVSDEKKETNEEGK